MSHIIVFEHANFHGAHKHIFDVESNLNAGDDSFFNDKISSFVILSGNWEFFLNSGFVAKLGATKGPGKYPSVTSALGGGSNDQISSLRAV